MFHIVLILKICRLVVKAANNEKKDTLVAEIFDRADKEMYKNKRTIKAG